MKKDWSFYRKLFLTTFSLSAFTFGGGYVIVPLIRKRFVDDNHWIDENEMLDIVAIAQSAPGIIAVNTSVLAGYRLAGVTGALLTTVATVLPPLITISIIAMFYAAFRSNAAVAAIMKTMQAGVAAVIVDAVFKMGATAVKGNNITAWLIMTSCFIASFVFHINVALIILACGIFGALNTAARARWSKGGGER